MQNVQSLRVLRHNPEVPVSLRSGGPHRSALTDDGRPPLDAAGIRLQQRLSVIEQSLDRVVKKGDCPSR